MKIFVVDHDTSLCVLYHDELEEDGHQVISANQAASVLETIKKQKPEIMILGDRLPDHESLDFLVEVKALFPQIKVIFDSNLKDLRQSAFDFGADYFSTKSSDLKDIKLALIDISAKKAKPPV